MGCHKEKGWPPSGRLVLLVLVVLLLSTWGAGAQSPGASTGSPGGAASPAASAAPLGSPSPTPIPEELLASQTAAVSKTLQSITDELAGDVLAADIGNGLPPMIESIDAQLAKNGRVIARAPVLDTLRALSDEVNAMRIPLDQWESELTRRIAVLDQDLAHLGTMQAAWRDALQRSRSNPDTPGSLLEQIQATIASVQQVRQHVEKYKTTLLSLQTQVAEQSARVTQADLDLEKSREAAVTRLFVQDSPPLWSRRAQVGQDLAEQAQEAIATQRGAFSLYCAAHAEAFLTLLVSILVMTCLVVWAGVRIKPWAADAPTVALVARVFDRPVAAAIILTTVLGPFLFVEPPRLLIVALCGVVLAPALMVLGRVLPPSARVLLPSLLALLLTDLVRIAAASHPYLQRIVILAQAVCATAFLIWLLKSNRLRSTPAVTGAERAVLGNPVRVLRVVRMGVRVALVGLVVAAVSVTAGYTVLARLALNLVAVSTYVAAIVYALVLVLDGLMVLFLRIPPLSRLGMVAHHLDEAHHRVHHWLMCGAGLTWLLIMLDILASRRTLTDKATAILAYQLSVGSLQIGVGGIVAFFLTVWLSFVVSRVLRCILNEEVYPRVEMERGVPYAVTSIVHYSVLLLGFLVALGALGVEMTKFTILVSAFGVGLGFGLQTMVNNFVSGVILLFERPVKVGDLLEMKEYSGEMQHIGLRASVLRTYDGSEVIVPNGTLLSNEVTNWTLSDLKRRIHVTVGTAYGSDPEEVMSLLCEAARAHPDVLGEPAPVGIFLGFGDSALNFEMRCWTAHSQAWLRILSELNVRVYRALQGAGIEIPFPQRDVHVHRDRSVKRRRTRESRKPPAAPHTQP